MKTVAVAGDFDDLRGRHVRFLQEAARLGDQLHVLLLAGQAAPKFPPEERKYFLEAIRYVDRVTVAPQAMDPDSLPLAADIWAVDANGDSSAKRQFAQSHGMTLQVIPDEQLAGFPEETPAPPSPGRKKVLVTGCYDWLHTGHVRFFEEVSEYGDVYVVVGHDANIRLLKGAGHPQFPQALRRYMAGSIRFVRQALVSTGHGWLDAEPEIRRLQPDLYAVNEDGDKPEKKAFCDKNGIEYLVLRRLPRPGLPRRQSTDLRGF